MGHDHATAAVSLEPELIHRITRMHCEFVVRDHRVENGERRTRR